MRSITCTMNMNCSNQVLEQHDGGYTLGGLIPNCYSATALKSPIDIFKKPGVRLCKGICTKRGAYGGVLGPKEPHQQHTSRLRKTDNQRHVQHSMPSWGMHAYTGTACIPDQKGSAQTQSTARKIVDAVATVDHH
jgi:hypothetical protein